jgi:hypothetical protein
MKTLFIIKNKKITAEADMLRELLQQKVEKSNAVNATPEPICQDLVHLQVNNHSVECFEKNEVFFGKRLAAAYAGLTASELFKPDHVNERRNKRTRNPLSVAEEETLHQTRVAIRNLQI